MSAIEIRGLRPIGGELTVQGSKNAVLPVMAAAVLHRGTTVIENVPGIQDVFCMMGILDSLGCVCRLEGHRLTLDASSLSGCSVGREEMERMRSSIMLLAPLLARCGEARVYRPGGCMIGRRPIDLHLMALEKLGARFDRGRNGEKEEAEDGSDDGPLTGKTAGFRGADVTFPFPSVGATENALFAAVAAEGTTVLHGCAREPEIGELCHFLNGMGASIAGIGSPVLRIEGGRPLHDSVYRMGGDRIVAGTYLLAAAGCGGSVCLRGVEPGSLRMVLEVLREMGACLREEEGLLSLEPSGRLWGTCVKTGPYPGFPTDLQPVMMAVMSLARGESTMEETVFESRYRTAGELKKLGASIRTEGLFARICGRERLLGAAVQAWDLRGGAALAAAALAAEGTTRIEGSQYIARGYEDICRDLGSLGAWIRAV